MNKVKLIIELDEDKYKFIQEQGYVPFLYDEVIATAVIDGTPLPKGHGRLIDADKLDRIMYHKAFETDSDMQKWDSGCWIRYKMFENSMEEVPTVIEADKT